MEKTLLVIKPDGVERRLIGEIIKRVEEDGFKIVNLKLVKLKKEEAEEFYIVHKGKDFYRSLVEYISSGPVIAILLQRERARERLREIVGATDPKKAEKGTIRADFGLDIEHNTVHAADPREDPDREIRFFFSNLNY